LGGQGGGGGPVVRGEGGGECQKNEKKGAPSRTPATSLGVQKPENGEKIEKGGLPEKKKDNTNGGTRKAFRGKKRRCSKKKR